MPVLAPPLYGHNWIPTPTIGRGGSKNGNHNLLCRACGLKVTKLQLLSDNLPAGECKPQKKAR